THNDFRITYENSIALKCSPGSGGAEDEREERVMATPHRPVPATRPHVGNWHAVTSNRSGCTIRLCGRRWPTPSIPRRFRGIGRWSGGARKVARLHPELYELRHALLGELALLQHGVHEVVQQLAELGRLDAVCERLGLGAELVHQLVGLLE